MASRSILFLSLSSSAFAQDGFKRDTADAAVWVVLFVIFSVQAVYCLRCLFQVNSRPTESSNLGTTSAVSGGEKGTNECQIKVAVSMDDNAVGRHLVSSMISMQSRAPYFALVISISLSILAAVFGIITDFAPFPNNLSFSISQYVLQTVLFGFPIVYLYGAIILFLRDRLRQLKTKTKPKEKHSNTYHCQTVVQALVFSLILCLDSGSAILQALLLKNAGDAPASADNVENDIIFWAAYAFRILSSVDLHVSSYLASKRLDKYGAKDEIISIIYRVVSPMYTANTFTTFILRLLRIKNATTPTFVVDLLSNIFYIAAISFLLYKLNRNAELSIIPMTNELVENSNAQEDLDGGSAQMKSEDELLDGYKPTNFTERAWLELFRHYKKREEESEKDFFHKDMNADSQVFSTLSVVTVFLATISVALTGIARDTYAEANSLKDATSQMSEVGSQLITGVSSLSPEDSVFSCFYLSTLISLMAACSSGLASAIRSLMARNIRNFVSQSSSDGALDRALIVTFIFTCLMMAVAVITLILGLILFVWDQQPVYVSVAMVAPGGVFVLAIFLAVFFHALDNPRSPSSS